MHVSQGSPGFGAAKLLLHQVIAHAVWHTPVAPHAHAVSASNQAVDPGSWLPEQQSMQSFIVVAAAHAESVPLLLPELPPLPLPLLLPELPPPLPLPELPPLPLPLLLPELPPLPLPLELPLEPPDELVP